jgi:Domain of unknown function (DUF6457)
MHAKQWLAAYAEQLGTDAPTAAEMTAVLDLAAEAAQASERTAAPVACWLNAKGGSIAGGIDRSGSEGRICRVTRCRAAERRAALRASVCASSAKSTPEVTATVARDRRTPARGPAHLWSTSDAPGPEQTVQSGARRVGRPLFAAKQKCSSTTTRSCRGRHASVWPSARQTPARDDEQAGRSSLLLLDSARPSRMPQLTWPLRRCGQ